MVKAISDSPVEKTVEVALLGNTGNPATDIFGYQLPPTGGSATTIVPKLSANYQVSGTIQYGSGAKNVRFALVQVYEQFPFKAPGPIRRLLGENYTNGDGVFTLPFNTLYPGGTGLMLRVFTRSDPSKPMQQLDVWSYGQTHCIDNYVSSLPTAGVALTVTLPPITDASNSGKAFWVYDAAVTAALFQASIPGLAKGATGIDFPATPLFATSLTYIKGTLHILAGDYNSPDTIMHEYGHSVAQKNGFFAHRLVTGFYWAHSPGYDMRAKLGWWRELPTFAFSEGWANFYSVASRNFAISGTVSFRTYDAERDQVRGETDEIGVMQLLWDLADPRNDDNVELSYDGAVGFQALCKLVNDKHVMNIDELWKALASTITASDVDVLASYGEVFAAHGMGARSLGMKIGGATSNGWTFGNPIPEFTWEIPIGFSYTNDATPPVTFGSGPLFNQFEVVVYDYDPVTFVYTEIVRSGILSAKDGRLRIAGNQGSWIPSAAEWDRIETSGSPEKRFVVLSRDSHTEVRGGGVSPLVQTSGPYWSKLSGFTVSP